MPILKNNTGRHREINLQCQEVEPRVEGVGRRTGRAESPGHSRTGRYATWASPAWGRENRPERTEAPPTSPLDTWVHRWGLFAPKSTAESFGSQAQIQVSSEWPAGRGTVTPPHGKYCSNSALQDRKFLRAHGPAGLHFPESTRLAFLSGSSSGSNRACALRLPNIRQRENLYVYSHSSGRSVGTTRRSLTALPKLPEWRESHSPYLVGSSPGGRLYLSLRLPAKIFQRHDFLKSRCLQWCPECCWKGNMWGDTVFKKLVGIDCLGHTRWLKKG